MGGRGSSSGIKTIPYDKWGNMKTGGDMELVYDETGVVIGHIEDEYRFIQEEDIRPVTKKR